MIICMVINVHYLSFIQSCTAIIITTFSCVHQLRHVFIRQREWPYKSLSKHGFVYSQSLTEVSLGIGCVDLGTTIESIDRERSNQMVQSRYCSLMTQNCLIIGHRHFLPSWDTSLTQSWCVIFWLARATWIEHRFAVMGVKIGTCKRIWPPFFFSTMVYNFLTLTLEKYNLFSIFISSFIHYVYKQC